MPGFLAGFLALLGLGAANQGCSGGGSSGGGGPAPGGGNPPPTAPVSVHTAVNSNLSGVSVDSSYRSMFNSDLITGASDGSTTVSGDIHVSVGGSMPQVGVDVAEITPGSGQQVQLQELGGPSVSFQA